MLYGKCLHKKLPLLIQKDFINVVLLTMILVYILPLDSRLLKPLQNLKLIFLSSPLSNPSPFHHNCQQPRYCEAFFYRFTRYFHFSWFRYCLSYAGDCILWLYGDPYTSNALYEGYTDIRNSYVISTCEYFPDGFTVFILWPFFVYTWLKMHVHWL